MAEQTKTGPGRGERWRAFRRSTFGSVLINVVAALLVLALVQSFFVKVYSVPSGSMQGTLYSGDRMLVNRTAYAGGVPPRGDVVVFTADQAWTGAVQARGNPVKELVRYFGDVTSIGPSHEKFLVKRVIGIPGDVVECCTAEGGLRINGQAQVEPYVQGSVAIEPDGVNCGTNPQNRHCFGPVTVPEGHLLVMGDNRGNSSDSVSACRGVPAGTDCAKFVPVGNVVGHAFLKVLPWDRIGTIS